MEARLVADYLKKNNPAKGWPTTEGPAFPQIYLAEKTIQKSPVTCGSPALAFIVEKYAAERAQPRAYQSLLALAPWHLFQKIAGTNPALSLPIICGSPALACNVVHRTMPKNRTYQSLVALQPWHVLLIFHNNMIQKKPCHNPTNSLWLSMAKKYQEKTRAEFANTLWLSEGWIAPHEKYPKKGKNKHPKSLTNFGAQVLLK